MFPASGIAELHRLKPPYVRARLGVPPLYHLVEKRKYVTFQVTGWPAEEAVQLYAFGSESGSVNALLGREVRFVIVPWSVIEGTDMMQRLLMQRSLTSSGF